MAGRVEPASGTGRGQNAHWPLRGAANADGPSVGLGRRERGAQWMDPRSFPAIKLMRGTQTDVGCALTTGAEMLSKGRFLT